MQTRFNEPKYNITLLQLHHYLYAIFEACVLVFYIVWKRGADPLNPALDAVLEWNVGKR